MAASVIPPGSAAAQTGSGVSAWTVTACRMEIQRRGWRIAANEGPGDSYPDGWAWFRISTDPTLLTDAVCREGEAGGIDLALLTPVTGDEDVDAGVPTDLLRACGAELERRGWTRSGGASMVRSTGTLLIQHVIADSQGAEGVGHCVYDDRTTLHPATDGAEDAWPAPVPTAVSAELIRPLQGADAACRETFQILGWSAESLSGTTPDPGRYRVRARHGAARNVECWYDPVAETVRIEMVR